jgi:hypothetical protein
VLIVFLKTDKRRDSEKQDREKMQDRVDFLVIGAQKSATSWLYYCLKEHPQLRLPAKKNEAEYLGGSLYQTRGADWYFSIFPEAKADQRVGGASVEYLFDPCAAPLVHRFLPKVNLIVSLRNPITRAISACYWEMRKNKLPHAPVDRILAEAMEAVEKGTGRSAGSMYEDVICRGFYDLQLKRYLQFFPSSQFFFILYEEIAGSAEAVLRKVYRALNVDSSFVPKAMRMKPKKNTYIQPLIALERLLPSHAISYKLLDKVNMFLGKMGAGNESPPISKLVYKDLYALYKPHVLETQRIIDSCPPASRPRLEAVSAWGFKD